MANKVEDLVNVILDSYNECDITARIDEENMLNKDILIEIIDEIRKVLFPGFFDNNKVRSEYLKFLVGERLEFIQYHLKKQNILNMYACIAYTDNVDEHLTNNSMQFHEHMGFRLIGTFKKCGYKFDKWYDMIWMEKFIGEHKVNPDVVTRPEI